jgi:hypothetical protein
MTTINHANSVDLRELNAAELDYVAGGKKIAMVTLQVAGMTITSNYDTDTSTVNTTVKVGGTYYGVASHIHV